MITLAWKIYFWICLLQWANSTPTLMFGFKSISEGIELLFFELPNWIMLLIALIGLRGFIYKKAYITAAFWRVFTPAFVLWSTGYFAYIWPQAQEVHHELADMLMLSVVFLALPQVWALIQYSYYKKPAF